LPSESLPNQFFELKKNNPERLSQRTYIVAQLGARMHYAVPRILAKNGMLEHFYTDFSASQGWPRLLGMVPPTVRPMSLQRMLGRIAQGVPSEKTTAFNFLGLRYAQQMRSSDSPTARSSICLEAGKQFCRQVLERGFGAATAVYTFNTAGLEILQAARHQGLLAVTEQTIAPKRVEVELLESEHESFPEWELAGGRDALAGEVIAREAAEWDAAHLILCACDFVRDGIAQCGGPVEKCVVVSYGVDVPNLKSEGRKQEAEIGGAPHTNPHPEAERKQSAPLRVLTVGTVGLRKGSPYVLEAAKILKAKAVFRMVGGIEVTGRAEEELRKHLELIGPVPRSEIAKHFEWADMFLLPSLCEGSATVTYEALAYGLPVICTPNTGSVVRDGMDGFIVPIRDAGSIVDRLEILLAQPGLRTGFSTNARLRAAEFTVSAYGTRLLAALTSASQITSLHRP